MIEVRQTLEFSSWLRRLKDDNAATRIVSRIRRMEQGNPGDVRSVGAGVMEMRIDYGPGYRVNFVQHGSAILILLCAGDKRNPSNRHQTSARARARNSRETIMVETTRFDAAEYLDTPERQAAYITAALETGDLAFVRDALGLVARAQGMAGVAKTAKLNRESLYKALGGAGNPAFDTILRVIRALGLTLAARPAEKKRAPKKRRAA